MSYELPVGHIFFFGATTLPLRGIVVPNKFQAKFRALQTVCYDT